MICLENIRPQDPVWSCQDGCHAVMHLPCIQVGRPGWAVLRQQVHGTDLMTKTMFLEARMGGSAAQAGLAALAGGLPALITAALPGMYDIPSACSQQALPARLSPPGVHLASPLQSWARRTLAAVQAKPAPHPVVDPAGAAAAAARGPAAWGCPKCRWAGARSGFAQSWAAVGAGSRGAASIWPRCLRAVASPQRRGASAGRAPHRRASVKPPSYLTQHHFLAGLWRAPCSRWLLALQHCPTPCCLGRPPSVTPHLSPCPCLAGRTTWLCLAATLAGAARCQTRSGTPGMLRTGGATTGLDKVWAVHPTLSGRGTTGGLPIRGIAWVRACMRSACNAASSSPRSVAARHSQPLRHAPCSCGELCGKPARGCGHPCVLLCHPGQAQHRG